MVYARMSAISVMIPVSTWQGSGWSRSYEVDSEMMAWSCGARSCSAVALTDKVKKTLEVDALMIIYGIENQPIFQMHLTSRTTRNLL